MQKSPTSLTLLIVLTMASVLAGTPTCHAAPKGAAIVQTHDSILPDDALFSKPVGGLERTNSKQETVKAVGQLFTRALRVTIGQDARETNVTQLTIDNIAPVSKGEALMASFAVRGAKADGKSPAELAFLFERNANPWTKSVMQTVRTPKDGKSWKKIQIVFSASEDYRPGEVMTSFRFAFGPQTVEVADLKVVSLGKGKSVDEIQQLAARANPLGDAAVRVNLNEKLQTMAGFGGNFCQARYGRTEKIDPVGQYCLDHLKVSFARVGLPLNFYVPEKGKYNEEGQAKAAWQLMQDLAQRKIPIIATIWEGPEWLLPGKREQSGRILSLDKYDDCIDAIVKFLVTARDQYKAPVDYFSFNEADYGVNFKFSGTEIVAFIKKAAPRFRAAGLKTRFLIGDTANGTNLAEYAAPLLADKALASVLGPIAFHSWDVLSASDKTYRAIAGLGQKYNRPVWCTEAGHDAQLWEKPNPWSSWENAVRLAAAYARTISLTRATTLLYWTYQDNYPLTTQDGRDAYPTFQVIQKFESAFPKGAIIHPLTCDNEGLQALAATNPNGKGVTLLLVNSVGTGKVTISGMKHGKKASINTLKSNTDSTATKVTYSRDNLTVDLPARSVTTVTLK